jgi:hypothetical protein
MMMEHARAAGLEAPHALSHAGAAPEDPEDAPAGEPEYADLLDGKWLERTADALEVDDDVVDIGLTLDLDEQDDADEHAYSLDLDVGTLLTSLPAAGVRESTASDPYAPERELGEGALALGALRELLLPEERAARQRADDDEEIGEDERFPAFDTDVFDTDDVDTDNAELPPDDHDGGEG